MKSYLHARVHAKKYGGVPDDYVDIDDFIDSSKAAVADVRHRAILHSAFGCFIVERVFGRTRVNSDGKMYSPRDIAEDHCLQDLSIIPTVENYLNNLSVDSIGTIVEISILEHSKIDSELYGIPFEIFLPIHQFLESSYTVMPDKRHHVLLHNSFGISIAEKIFGVYIQHLDVIIPTKEVVTNHISREFLFIPTMEYYLQNMSLENWMSGSLKHNRKRIRLVD